MSNRQLKFRGWIAPGAKMTKPFDLEWMKENSPVPEDFTKRSLFDDNMLFQQFTGLQDSNGNDVYDSDILYHKAVHTSEDGLGTIDGKPYQQTYENWYVVEWFECGWASRRVHYKSTFAQDGEEKVSEHFDRDEVPSMLYPTAGDRTKVKGEVVGNIYENPELLKDTNAN